jgi:predicted transposase YdaD
MSLHRFAENAMPGVMRRLSERINAEPRPRAANLWTATYLLMGLRYEDERVTQLLEGVEAMRASSTYQAILREGREEGRLSEAQRLLLLLGASRFGAATEITRSAVEAIRDLERLEGMSKRVLDASVQDWDSLLEAP